MHLVDVVRYGSAAAGKPQAGMLYAQLVHDYVRGQTLTAQDYAALVGVVPRQVQRYLKDLSDWGVITIKGRTRGRKVLLESAPNLQFCEAIVTGMYGPEVLEDVRKGNRAAELCPNTGHSDPVANYAVQVLLGLYANRPFVTYSYSQPTATSGTGAVKLVTNSDISFGHPLVDMLKEVVVVSNYVQILSSNERMSECADVRMLATYPTELPAGILVEPKTMSQQVRAAKTKRDTLPENSFGLVYWPMTRLREIDVEHFDTVSEVLDTWNETVGTGEKLNPRLYARIRNLLVEESLTTDQLYQAFRAARIDSFWKDKMLWTLSGNPSNIRGLLKQHKHDRLGRNMDVHPKGEVIAVEF